MLHIYRWSKNSQHIEALITELSKDDKFLIPAFLLRAQLIEYALKYLLIHAPYKPKCGLSKKAVEDMTMGEVIAKLEKCEDGCLDRTIESAQIFKDFRNEVTHHLVSSDKTIREIGELIKEKLQIAVDIERQIIYFADFVKNVLGVNLEEIK